MDVSLGIPVDRVASLLQSLKVGNAKAAQDGVLQLYTELKECYETQERAAPAEYAGDQDEDVKQACKQASLLFVARVLFATQQTQQKDGESQPLNLGCSISRIVAAAGINLLDFFREVNVVVSKLSPYFEARGGSSKLFSQQAQLKENSETVVVMGLLAKKYKDNFNMFLHQLDFFKQLVMRLGWNAFLILRVKLLSAFPDVVSCVELLPCIFAILASHAPRLPDCLSHITRESRGLLLLKSMSEMCKADYNRVRARMPSVEALLTQIFTTAVPEWRAAVAAAKLDASQPTGATIAAGALDLVACPVLDGLVSDPHRINLVIAALEQEYDQHYARGGSELDERDFLATDFSKFASPRFSPGQMHSAMNKFRGGPTLLRPGALLGPGAHTTAPSHPPMSHPTPVHMRIEMVPGLHSPLPTMHLAAAGPAGTPVSEAMGTSAWLRSMTSNMAAEPSATLQHFLSAVPLPSASGTAGLTAAQQMARRVRDMVASVIPEESAPALLGPFPVLQPSLMAERRTEAMKLYYHSLESILLVEEKANGLAGVTALLSSAKFHRGLIACCVEVVSACYRMIGCAFPKVLDVLRIKAFDLVKMIESFVKNVANLPRELKRHLFLIEEKILESLAWEPGSSLYPLIMNVHSENEVAQEAADQAAAYSVAMSMLDSNQRSTGCKAGPSPSSAADSGAAASEAKNAAAASSAAPEGITAELKETGDVSGPAAGTAAAPGAQAAGSAAVAAPPLSPKRPQGATFSGLMSPAKKARGTAGSYSTQPFSDLLPVCIGLPPAGVPLAGTSAGALYDFCRKVLKLASFRLAVMCENFDFSPLDRSEVACRVYETIEYAMYRQTHLFYNRHIDQIMLSALYGYCKVHKLAQVSFREIITQYRKQPQANQSIFRSVVIEQSNPSLLISSRADIIAFYNQVFVPSMKGFLLKGEANSGAIPCGPGNATDGKPTGPASSAHGTPAGSSVGWSTLGLPPLPPRCSSQSPRGPKLSSPLPTAAAPLTPHPGFVMFPDIRGSEWEALRQQIEGKRDSEWEALRQQIEGKVERDGDGDDNPSSRQPQSLLPPTIEATASRHPTSSQASVNALAGKGSGVRTRSVAATDHHIPDGLAALLQALDSQQGSDSKEEDATGTRHGPVTRSGRGPAAMDAAGTGDGARDRVPGRERRSTRHSDRRDDAMDGDCPNSPETSPLPSRRQRTPNRRYGND